MSTYTRGTPSALMANYRGWNIYFQHVGSDASYFIQDPSGLTNDYFAAGSILGVEHIIDVMLNGENYKGFNVSLTHTGTTQQRYNSATQKWEKYHDPSGGFPIWIAQYGDVTIKNSQNLSPIYAMIDSYLIAHPAVSPTQTVISPVVGPPSTPPSAPSVVESQPPSPVAGPTSTQPESTAQPAPNRSVAARSIGPLGIPHALLHQFWRLRERFIRPEVHKRLHPMV